MLEVEAIDTYRGAAQILQRVSLKVGDHECVCLVGRNGAGKTTTMILGEPLGLIRSVSSSAWPLHRQRAQISRRPAPELQLSQFRTTWSVPADRHRPGSAGSQGLAFWHRSVPPPRSLPTPSRARCADW